MTASPILEMFLKYINDNYLLGILFVLSLIFYIRKGFHMESRVGRAALLTVVFLFLTVFNPLIFKYLVVLADGGASYYRFIWILPLTALSACFLTEIVSMISRKIDGLQSVAEKKSSDEKKRKSPPAILLSALTVIVLCITVIFSGTSYLTRDNLTVPENKFGISRTALDISQFIHDDPDHVDGAVILAPTEIMMELEAYDITLVPALARSEYLSYGSGTSDYEPLLSVVLEGAHRNTDYMVWNLYSLDVDYIVCLTLFNLDSYMENIDYDLYNRTGDYTLYKRSPDAHSFY